MDNVTRLVTRDERVARKAQKECPSIKPAYDRFCVTCQKSLVTDQETCGEGHEIKELTARQKEAEASFMMFHYS